jgi:hypothetical protein
MAILDEPTDEHSPLKKDVEISTTSSSTAAAQATAPPPYTLIPTPSPNPIPPSQAIPQTDPQSLYVLLSRRSAIVRFLRAFGVACLVLLLWSAFVHSFSKKKNRHLHSYEYEVVRFHSIYFYMLLD